MRSTTWSILLLAAAVAASGCTTKQPYVTPQRLDQGLVVVFTGIEGRSPFNQAIARGLDEGGVPYAIEVNDWTVHVPMAYLLNLRAEEHNRDKAQRIADRLARYQLTHPGKPVYLVGQSGGAAMAVWVAQSMPMGMDVDGVVLLAASLSPGYDLDMPLFKSKQGIVNFYSPNDYLFLMFGTTFLGTMDGQHSSSAGRVGFVVRNPRMVPFNRLYQVAWREDMVHTGNLGLHLTSGAAPFVRQYVAPLVRAKQWSRELVRGITGPASAPASGPAASSQPAAVMVVPARPLATLLLGAQGRGSR